MKSVKADKHACEVVVVDQRSCERRLCFWRKRTEWACRAKGRYAVEERKTSRFLLACGSHVIDAVRMFCGE